METAKELAFGAYKKAYMDYFKIEISDSVLKNKFEKMSDSSLRNKFELWWSNEYTQWFSPKTSVFIDGKRYIKAE
jgi:hypothetical protein